MERKGKGADIIEFPKRAKAPGAELGNAKDAQEDARIFQMPMKTLTKREALDELKRIVGCEAEIQGVYFLAFPDSVRFSSFPGGFEMFDVETERPSGRNQDETFREIAPWVKSWYLSVFEKGGKLICRYVNKDESCTLVRTALEQPIRDPDSRYGRFTLESFIDTLIYGDPPD